MRAKGMSYMSLSARNMPPYSSAEQAHPGRRGAANGTGFSWVFGACTSSLRLMVQVLGEGQYGFKRFMRKLKQKPDQNFVGPEHLLEQKIDQGGHGQSEKSVIQINFLKFSRSRL